jgi:hypothetical protein
MINGLERTWKEVVMAYFEVLSRHSPEGTTKFPARILDALAKIRIWYLLNRRQECYSLAYLLGFFHKE